MAPALGDPFGEPLGDPLGARLVVRFWGVRGSAPSPGPRTARYGGNTPCVELRVAGAPPLVLDAGTGARPLGDALAAEARARGAPPDVALCLTHAHWDHIQGLPFFAPLYAPGARVELLLPAPFADAIESAVREQMRPPRFPVAWERLAAAVTFTRLPADGTPLVRSGLAVRALAARHPDGAAGLRVETQDGARSVVYLPDNELADASGASAERAAMVTAARGASLLIHDATYTPDEIAARRGWGHSSWDEAVRLAADAGARRLVLFHHHADRTDAAVDAAVRAARAACAGSGVGVVAAAEGLVLHA